MKTKFKVQSSKFKVILLCLLCSFHAFAQESNMRQIYEQAEEDYNIGRIEQAMTLLGNNIDKFQGGLKQSAYRLMVLCSLGQDKSQEAEAYAKELLKAAPFYTPLAQDPIRFTDMINRIKSGSSATITTASSQAESLDEVPVPVTLITEEMIRLSGARNLKELLILYVPGMTNVECNEEMNIAMRGIYSSGQEKILIMLNGHRLNSYSTNVARPDFSISLEKIKQIEVLRGPASSLYGGVALTAVVNIITKSGGAVDGLQVRGSIGNYGQVSASAIFGKRYLDFDLMAWSSFYKSDGEKYYLSAEDIQGASITPGDVRIGAFNRQPSYDIGFVLGWKDLRFMYNSCSSKTVAPYSMSYFFSPYSYDKYMTFDNNAPGYATTSQHSEVQYSKEISLSSHNVQNSKFNIQCSISYDTESNLRYQIATDRLPELFPGYLIPVGTQDTVFVSDGVFQIHKWHEQDISGHLQLGYHYAFGGHQGQLLAGAEYHRFELIDSYYAEGANYNEIIVTYDDSKNLLPGKEYFADGFVQLKHQWKQFILNAGFRYDYKLRSNDMKIDEWSPRVALIIAHPKWNAKLSYSRSFVDAPYFYRNNTLDTTMGGEGLLSEYLDSWQFSFVGNSFLNGLKFELTAFYNNATNLVHPEGMFYYNSGGMKSIGLELNSRIYKNRFTADLNLTWQHLISSEDYKTSGQTIYNIPKLSANLIATYRFTDRFRLSATANYMSCQTSTLEMPDEDSNPIYYEMDIPSRIICGINGAYSFNKTVELGMRTFNVFGKRYTQGGTSIGPIQQQGFWMLADLTITL